MAEETAAKAETPSIPIECGALLFGDRFVHASRHHGSGWIAGDLFNLDARGPDRPGALVAEFHSLFEQKVPVNSRHPHEAEFVEADGG